MRKMSPPVLSSNIEVSVSRVATSSAPNGYGYVYGFAFGSTDTMASFINVTYQKRNGILYPPYNAQKVCMTKETNAHPHGCS